MEKKSLSLKMRPELYEKVAEYSKKEVRTVSNSISYILERFFILDTEESEGHKEQK